VKRTRFLEDEGYRILRFWNNDNQTCVVTNKIGNILPERHLPTEAMAGHLRRSQDSPNASLGIGHALPLGSGTAMRAVHRMLFHRSSVTSPPPKPAPIEGAGSQFAAAAIDNLLT
jgi:hypothetical protein